MKRGAWRTRLGFYLAAIGTAFGLGNLWRFPYVVGSHGGGAFVLIYVALALLIGLSLLIAELMIGRVTRQGIIGGLKKLGGGRAWTVFGALSLTATIIALSYYAVISGWVLHFMSRFFVSFVLQSPFSVDTTLKILMGNGYLQMALTSAHLLIASVIIAKGVQEGLERWIGWMMPVFIVLMTTLLIQSLLLPSAGEALQFLFYPDFSKLKAGSLVQAVGHVLFTLSLGFGTMVVFGSYLGDDTHIPSAGFRVAMLDTTLSLLAGLVIFPIVFADRAVDSANLNTGPELLFQTLPTLFQGPGGSLWGCAFFLCLYLAALGASIGLLEAAVSNIMDFLKIKRGPATLVAGFGGLLLAIFPALSSTAFSGVRYRDMGLLAIVDAVLITGILPLIGLGISLFVGWKMKAATREEFFIAADRQASVRLYPNWLFVLRWMAPLVIAGSLLIELVGIFLSA